MCHIDQNFYFFTVFFSNNTLHIHFKALIVKDKVAKSFLLKNMHFLLLLTCLKFYLLFKGSIFQLDPKKTYFLHLEAALNQFSPPLPLFFQLQTLA